APVRSRAAPVAPVAALHRLGGFPSRSSGLQPARGTGLLGARVSEITATNQRARRKAAGPFGKVGKALNELDDRLGVAKGGRTFMDKIFPDHWSFMLGEIALYSFVILLV